MTQLNFAVAITVSHYPPRIAMAHESRCPQWNAPSPLAQKTSVASIVGTSAYEDQHLQIPSNARARWLKLDDVAL